MSALVKSLNDRFRSYVNIIPAVNHTFINIVHARAQKHRALQRLLGARGLGLEKVLAFGDDLPDLTMLEACGYSVAMANGVEAVKAVAGYQAESNNADGVGLFLEAQLENW